MASSQLIYWGLGLCLGGLLLHVLSRWWIRRFAVTEEQRIEAARTKKQMEQLIETEGWKMLRAAAKAQLGNRQNTVMLNPTKDLAEENYLKGEIQGLTLLISLPEKLIEQNDAILKLALEQEDNT